MVLSSPCVQGVYGAWFNTALSLCFTLLQASAALESDNLAALVEELRRRQEQDRSMIVQELVRMREPGLSYTQGPRGRRARAGGGVCGGGRIRKSRPRMRAVYIHTHTCMRTL